MLHSRSRALTCAIVLACLVSASGCVTRGYPTHGGGKRFYNEQAIVTRSIDAALAEIDFGKVVAALPAEDRQRGTIAVHLFAVAHSGGGVQTPSSGLFGGILGGSLLFGGSGDQSVLGAGQQGIGAAVHAVPLGVGAVPGNPNGYFAFGFESADDIRYLMGRVIGRLGEVGLRVETPTANAGRRPVLCIMISELGIDQSDFNALVYSEKKLRARAALEAFLVGHHPDDPEPDSIATTAIGKGAATFRFREDFFLGCGPLSGGVPEQDVAEDGR